MGFPLLRNDSKVGGTFVWIAGGAERGKERRERERDGEADKNEEGRRFRLLLRGRQVPRLPLPSRLRSLGLARSGVFIRIFISALDFASVLSLVVLGGGFARFSFLVLDRCLLVVSKVILLSHLTCCYIETDAMHPCWLGRISFSADLAPDGGVLFSF